MQNHPTCQTHDCNESPILNGLCDKHYLKQMQQKFERELTIEAIHTGLIDGEPPKQEGLSAELQQVKSWWAKAYDAFSRDTIDSDFQEETEQVPEWCITIAKAIIDEERACKEGHKPDSFLNFEKRHTLGFFKNMEAGLMSNGDQRIAV